MNRSTEVKMTHMHLPCLARIDRGDARAETPTESNGIAVIARAEALIVSSEIAAIAVPGTRS